MGTGHHPQRTRASFLKAGDPAIETWVTAVDLAMTVDQYPSVLGGPHPGANPGVQFPKPPATVTPNRLLRSPKSPERSHPQMWVGTRTDATPLSQNREWWVLSPSAPDWQSSQGCRRPGIKILPGPAVHTTPSATRRQAPTASTMALFSFGEKCEKNRLPEPAHKSAEALGRKRSSSHQPSAGKCAEFVRRCATALTQPRDQQLQLREFCGPLPAPPIHCPQFRQYPAAVASTALPNPNHGLKEIPERSPAPGPRQLRDIGLQGFREQSPAPVRSQLPTATPVRPACRCWRS